MNTITMPKPQSSKSIGPAAFEKDPSQTSGKPIKKQRSLRSLFSFLKSSKKVSEYYYPSRGSALKGQSFSTFSLPAQVPIGEGEDDESSDTDSPRGRWHSTTSLPSQVRPPFACHTPSSSSSSASSLEFPSDTSTAATSPSNSSPSILIKSLSSASIVTMNSTASATSTRSMEHNSPPNQALTKSTKMSKSSKRATDSYRKQPSPLSSVMDAHSPYTFPTIPQTSTHENQPKRRSSLGNFLLRRTQSHPDLADLTQEYLPPLPPMPASAPSSRPTSSSSSISRAKTFRRRSGDLRKTDGMGGYTEDQKIERMSILGADPAGYGYYLYPTSEKKISSQKNSRMSPPSGKRGRPGYVDDWKRNSWGGAGSDGFGGGRVSNAGPSGKAWKDSRGRSFRRTVTQAIPEEAGDAFDSESTSLDKQFTDNSTLGYPRQNLALAASDPKIPATPSKTDKEMSSRIQPEECTQSPHNCWNSIHTRKQLQEIPSSMVPCEEAKTQQDSDRGDEAMLREQQQGVQRAMDAVAEGFEGKTTNFSRPNTAGSEPTRVNELKDGLPMFKVNMIQA